MMYLFDQAGKIFQISRYPVILRSAHSIVLICLLLVANGCTNQTSPVDLLPVTTRPTSLAATVPTIPDHMNVPYAPPTGVSSVTPMPVGSTSIAEIYYPATKAFSLAADMPTVRYKHIGSSFLLKNGKALIAGGARNAVVYDPLTNMFTSVPGVLGTNVLSRLFSTATLLRDGSVLITGGYGVNQSFSAQARVYRY
jgi:hypothetical protein